MVSIIGVMMMAHKKGVPHTPAVWFGWIECRCGCLSEDELFEQRWERDRKALALFGLTLER